LFDADAHKNFFGVKVEGKVEIHQYSLQGNKLLASSSHHTDSCRALAYSEDGGTLYTASADASIGTPDQDFPKFFF
jgi:hypothetical protein